jgi:hypothetical protein
MRTAMIIGRLKKAKRECPWACKFERVCGGYKNGKMLVAYMAFESWTDWGIWASQK